MRADAGAIGAPTLLIAGAHYSGTTVDDARMIENRIARSRRMHIAASHLSSIEAASAFNEALLQFLL